MTEDEAREEAFKIFPVKLRECGDGGDENFIKRECFVAGALWVVKKRHSGGKG